MTDTVCAYPWILSSIGSDGKIRPCCNATNSEVYEVDGERSNIKSYTSYSIDTILGAATLQKMREQMLVGERPSICARCWKMEDDGVDSFRFHANRRFPNHYKEIIDRGKSSPLRVKRLELDLGITCNLKCRMCGPHSSSMIQKETIEHESSSEYYYGNGVQTDEWVDVVDIKEYLMPHLNTIEEIYLIGGEPLIIDAHRQLLEYLVEVDCAKNIRLMYNTNAISIGSKFIELWSNFGSVHLSISVDGIGAQYEYIRNPAKWNTINKNVRLLADLMRQEDNNIRCSISTTLQNLTLPCFREFFEWVTDVGLDLTVIPVNYPHFLEPSVMPIEHYAKFLQELVEYRDCRKIEIERKQTEEIFIPNWEMQNQHALNDAIRYLESNIDGTNNIQHQMHFLRKQQLLDFVRKQNLFDVHPWAKDIEKCLD